MTSPNTNTVAADPVQAYLDRGLRNYWYPVAPSWQVANAPIGLTRLGDQIVLWRDQEGKVHALEDRCPHRGARLSQGRVRANAIVCPYHGISIDADGRIASVPALPGCPIEGRLAVRTYAVHEIADAIFAYFPTPAGEAPIPLDQTVWAATIRLPRIDMRPPCRALASIGSTSVPRRRERPPPRRKGRRRRGSPARRRLRARISLTLRSPLLLLIVKQSGRYSQQSISGWRAKDGCPRRCCVAST